MAAVTHATFDKKFGSDRLAQLPTSPGIYIFEDERGEVIYVGKAKNLRKRLANYRNSSRKKAHRKMRVLVQEAVVFRFEALETEEQALLRENELIRELSPTYNVDGAYAFLYPAFGVAEIEKLTLLAFTATPEAFSGFSWYGVFRSRPRAKDAFSALADLLALVGHREKSTRLPPYQHKRGSRLVGFRQIPKELSESLPWFFAGDEPELLGELAKALLQKPRARREAEFVQEALLTLKEFHATDLAPLRRALRDLGRPGSFISGEERDSLFIRHRFRGDKTAT